MNESWVLPGYLVLTLRMCWSLFAVIWMLREWYCFLSTNQCSFPLGTFIGTLVQSTAPITLGKPHSLWNCSLVSVIAAISVVAFVYSADVTSSITLDTLAWLKRAMSPTTLWNLHLNRILIPKDRNKISRYIATAVNQGHFLNFLIPKVPSYRMMELSILHQRVKPAVS